MRDHCALVRDMELFHFEAHSSGIVFWRLQGLRLFHYVEHFIQQIYSTHRFEEVRSPMVLN